MLPVPSLPPPLCYEYSALLHSALLSPSSLCLLLHGNGFSPSSTASCSHRMPNTPQKSQLFNSVPLQFHIQNVWPKVCPDLCVTRELFILRLTKHLPSGFSNEFLLFFGSLGMIKSVLGWSFMVGWLGWPVPGQELDALILLSPFWLRRFYGFLWENLRKDLSFLWIFFTFLPLFFFFNRHTQFSFNLCSEYILSPMQIPIPFY